jgi:hypothetical protein
MNPRFRELAIIDAALGAAVPLTLGVGTALAFRDYRTIGPFGLLATLILWLLRSRMPSPAEGRDPFGFDALAYSVALHVPIRAQTSRLTRITVVITRTLWVALGVEIILFLAWSLIGR